MFAEQSLTHHNRQTNKKLVKIIHTLLQSQQSVAFRKPVPHKALGLGDYKKIVKKPIDLNQIRRQNNETKYKIIEDALDDIQLCWDNCKLYNHAKSELYRQAISLQKQFWDLVKENFPEIYEKTKEKMKEQAIVPQKGRSENNQSQQEEQSDSGMVESKHQKLDGRMDIEAEEVANSQMDQEIMESQGGQNLEEKSQRSKSQMIKETQKQPILVSLRERPTAQQIKDLTMVMKKIDDKGVMESVLEILFTHQRQNLVASGKGEMSFKIQKIHLSTYHRICKAIKFQPQENLQIIE